MADLQIARKCWCIFCVTDKKRQCGIRDILDIDNDRYNK